MCARIRYHFPIRLGRAGKVGVVHRKPSKLSRGETDPLVGVVRPPCIIAAAFGGVVGGFLSALSERQAIINQSDCACHIRSTGSRPRSRPPHAEIDL